MKEKDCPKPIWTEGIINYNPKLPNPKETYSVIVDNDRIDFYKRTVDENGEDEYQNLATWHPGDLLFFLLELVGYKNVEGA